MYDLIMTMVFGGLLAGIIVAVVGCAAHNIRIMRYSLLCFVVLAVGLVLKHYFIHLPPLPPYVMWTQPTRLGCDVQLNNGSLLSLKRLCEGIPRYAFYVNGQFSNYA